MRRMLILVLLPLGWAMPASAQDAPPDQTVQQAPASQAPASQAPASQAPVSQAPACQARSGQSIGQNIRSDLAQAGYRDIQIVPDSFVVRAKDPTGVPVMMVFSPNAATVVTEATPVETSGLPADAPPDADTPVPDRCVLPNVEEELVGAMPPIDAAFDVASMGATPD
jgi:hypothetical protein